MEKLLAMSWSRAGLGSNSFLHKALGQLHKAYVTSGF
jgi:hypothetical protein